MPPTTLPSTYELRLNKSTRVSVPASGFQYYAKVIVRKPEDETKSTRYVLRLKTGPQLLDLAPAAQVPKKALQPGGMIGFSKAISENEARMLAGVAPKTPKRRGRPKGSKNKNSKKRKSATAKECVKLTTKRATQSPRPPYNADACRDMSMKGNDGANWESRPSKPGSPYKWYKKGSALTKKGNKKVSRKTSAKKRSNVKFAKLDAR